MHDSAIVRYLNDIVIEKIASSSGEINPDEPLRFIASTESVDRYQDVIRVSGWNLDNYRRNPVVLFAHQQTAPVGTAEVWIDGKALMSEIKLADQGTAPVVDYVRALVRQRILRAVSVGFLPLEEPKPIKQDGAIVGFEYRAQELAEISLVAVPANPEALAIAKAMKLPSEFIGEPPTLSRWQARAQLMKIMPRMATINQSKGR